MVAQAASAVQEMAWSDDALHLHVRVDGNGVPRLCYLAPPAIVPTSTNEPSGTRKNGHFGGGSAGSRTLPLGLPLLDVVVAGCGQAFSGRRYSESVVGGRMCYAGHTEHDDGDWHELRVMLEDPGSGLVAETVYRALVGTGVLQSRVRIANRGTSPLTVESVTSFLGGGLAGPSGPVEDVEVLWAENDWLSESRWHRRALRDAVPDLNRAVHGRRSRSRFGLTSQGTWSSGTYLPMGAVVNRQTGHTLLWQIEHNGGWHWQVGEQTGEGPGGSYLALLGPTDIEHQWRAKLRPGESFETVPVAVAVSGDGFEDAVARLTKYRRASRRPHEDHRRLPVIFNDYMNTLMGDPTTERLMPLVTAAARAGAEYFCIDAGWYSEIGEAWWDTVGEWLPSKSRFPNGIVEVLDHIRAEGMVPGLWLEPEVVGINSSVADRLPAEAFFTRDREIVVESGRYQLDFSHPLARAHVTKVVDFLVQDLGIGYLKMDYNINVAPGTDASGLAPGAGMLAHNRALLEWVDELLGRHPGLTIENCSSGGMRTDYALLSRLQLQSTSDQQDYLRYPPIAAAAPAAIAPEQAAVWAYPQPEWDDDKIAFTLCSAMLGRLHLSGNLNRMAGTQQRLVEEAVQTYKTIRDELAEAVPFWPLGLPAWDDPWVALGMRSERASYLIVWRRHKAYDDQGARTGPASIRLKIAPKGTQADPHALYPKGSADLRWQPAEGQLDVTLPRSPSACLIDLGTRSLDRGRLSA